MTLPLTTANASTAFSALVQRGAALTSMCQQVQGGTAPWVLVPSMIQVAQAILAEAQTVVSSPTLQPALNQYVQQITGNTTYNYLPDFQTSMAALGALVAALISDCPKDAGGHLLFQTMDATGAVANVMIVPANIPNTMNAITAWLATIS